MDDRLPDRGINELQLHHLHRAMAWLGEEIAPPLPALVPCRVKDLLEKHLFERRRDLFSDLSLVFIDTTSLSFYGACGDSLGLMATPRTFAPT
jgi:hypothetical protein